MHAAQFSKTAAPPRRVSPLSALGAAGATPRRTEEYSTAQAGCLGGGPQAAEAPLAHLQHAPGEAISSEVEGFCGHLLAIELHASLLDQAPSLAAADAEGAGDQARQVDEAVAVGPIIPQVDLRHLLRRRVVDEAPVEAQLGGRPVPLGVET